VPGFIARDTGIAAATGSVASVHAVRKGEDEPQETTHYGDILFGYVMAGQATIEGAGQIPQLLSQGDAVAIPPGLATRLSGVSADFEMLEVALPGSFDTKVG
jgi:quercetin dioxygenase-like cupin family protein